MHLLPVILWYYHCNAMLYSKDLDLMSNKAQTESQIIKTVTLNIHIITQDFSNPRNTPTARFIKPYRDSVYRCTGSR